MAITVKGDSPALELSKEEEMAKREASLNKMEVDIREKCAQLDATEESLSVREKELNESIDQREKEFTESIDQREKELEVTFDKREKEIEKALGLTKDSDLFLRFYENVNQIYTLWCASKGTSAGLIESVQKILDARQSIQKDEI